MSDSEVAPTSTPLVIVGEILQTGVYDVTCLDCDDIGGIPLQLQECPNRATAERVAREHRQEHRQALARQYRCPACQGTGSLLGAPEGTTV